MLARILPKRSLIITAIALAPSCLLASAPTTANATAGINQTINFQGKVANSSGTNVADGTYDFVFKIYDGASSSATNLFTENWTSGSLFSSTMSSAPTSGGQSLVYSSDTNEATLAAGQILWNTTKKESVKIVSVNTASNIINISPTRQAWSTSDTVTNRIYVKDGLFTVSINSLNHNLSGVDFNSDSIYLGINFNSDGEMKPRIEFSAVPYAFNSQKVNGVSVTNTSGSTPATGTTIKIGDNKTLQFNNSLTFAGTDGKTLTVNNTLTFGGTDGTSFTLPSTSGTLTTSSATSGQIAFSTGTGTLAGDSNIFWDNTNKRLGIGTAAPKNKLDVAGGLAVGSFAGVNTAPTNGLIVSGSIGIGTDTPSQALTLGNNSNISVDMSSTVAPTLTPSASGGTLASGTYYYVVTPLDGSGGEGLGNEASTVVTGPSGSVSLSWASTGGAASYRIYRGTSTGAENTYFTSTSTSFTDTGAAGTAGAPPTSRTASINRFTANGASWFGGSSASLGIGTSAPADAIHVSKGSSTDVGITIQNTFSTTGETASLNFRTGNVSSTMGRISLERVNSTNAKLNLATIQSGTLTTGLTLDNTGLVGIGTTSPTGELAINGVLNVALSGTLAATNGSPNITGTSTSFTTSLSVGDAINVNGAAYTVGSITDDTHLTLTSNYTGSTRTGIAATIDPTFLTIANGAGSSVMKLTKTGYLGLGTSTGITARLTLAADTTPAGGIQFGSDTNLYRSAADTLKTDDVFVANGGLIIGSGGSKISKFLSTTTTWDPASTLNAASTSTTVSVSGATLGDTVLVSFDQAVPAGVSLTGQVTASGTVTVTLSNLSGSSQDLASGTLRVDILQH